MDGLISRGVKTGGGGALKWDFTVYEMQWGLEMRNDLHSLITI